MISLATFYRKTRRRLAFLEDEGFLFEEATADVPHVRRLLAEMASIARSRGLNIYSCATETDLADLGIQPGRCVDVDLLRAQFGLTRPFAKDAGQRKSCGCANSRDIGAVDTCLHGCVYCYATNSDKTAQRRYASHDQNGERLIQSSASENKPSLWRGSSSLSQGRGLG
jgi:hypothetical protein